MFLTPMRQYLKQLSLEQMEGFEEDAGLTDYTWFTATDRAVWWENFSKSAADTRFLYAKEAASQYKYMLYTLMEAHG